MSERTKLKNLCHSLVKDLEINYPDTPWDMYATKKTDNPTLWGGIFPCKLYGIQALMSSYPNISFAKTSQANTIFLSANVQFQRPKELFMDRASYYKVQKLCDKIQQATGAKIYILKRDTIQTTQPLAEDPTNLLDPLLYPVIDVTQCNVTFLKFLKSALEQEQYNYYNPPATPIPNLIIAIGYEIDTTHLKTMPALESLLKQKIQYLVPYVQYLAEFIFPI